MSIVFIFAIFVIFEKYSKIKEFLVLSPPDNCWHFNIYNKDKFRAKLSMSMIFFINSVSCVTLNHTHDVHNFMNLAILEFIS